MSFQFIDYKHKGKSHSKCQETLKIVLLHLKTSRTSGTWCFAWCIHCPF